MERPADELTMTSDNRMQLESVARLQSLPAGLARCTRMILRLKDGTTNRAVARRVGASRAPASF